MNSFISKSLPFLKSLWPLGALMLGVGFLQGLEELRTGETLFEGSLFEGIFAGESLFKGVFVEGGFVAGDFVKDVVNDIFSPDVLYTLKTLLPVVILALAWGHAHRAEGRLASPLAAQLALILAGLLATGMSGLFGLHLLLQGPAWSLPPLDLGGESAAALGSWGHPWVHPWVKKPWVHPWVHPWGEALAGLICTLGIMAERGIRWQHQRHRRITHGSARLATLPELRREVVDTSPYGLPLGWLATPYKPYEPEDTLKALHKRPLGPLVKAVPAHTLVIAPSGAGKGVGYVIPTLLDYGGAVFVTDMKGENYAVTARARRAKGQNVVALDPFGLTDRPSLTLNPLELCQPESPTFLEDMATLAHSLIPTNRFGTENEQHFSEHGASLLHCLLLYVKLADVFKEDERHLGTVYNLLSLSDDKLKAQLLLLTQHPQLAEGTVARLALSYYGTAEREFSGITNTARKHLRFLEAPAVRAVLQRSTLDLKDLTQGTTDLFLCLPPEHLDTQFRLIRLLIALVFTTFKKARGVRAPAPLLMVIDELPALEYIPELENMLVYGRGYGVTLMGFAQTLELIQSLYPKTWRTFLSGAVTIFFEAHELTTATYVSQKLGTSTLTQTSHVKGRGRHGGGGIFSRAPESTTQAPLARPLLTPDEVACLGASVSIVFIKGSRPLLLRRPCYYRDKLWQGQFDANPLEEPRGSPAG